MNPVNRNHPETTAMRQRLDELLADRAVLGLTANEETELELLRAQLGVGVDLSLEQAAAVANQAMLPAGPVALPESLRQSILAAGRQFARSARGEIAGTVTPAVTPSRATVTHRVDHSGRHNRRTWHVWRGASAWTGWVAAAACLTVAVWVSRPRSISGPGPGPGPQASLLNSASELYDKIMGSRRDDIVVVPSSNEDGNESDVKAELVYDPEGKTTLLLIGGLPANDPSSSRYQAFVQDGSRDDGIPVSAGMIDIPHTGATYVFKINPQLPVSHPIGFKLTRERPEGSVVSPPDRTLVSGKLSDPRDIGPPRPDEPEGSPINMGPDTPATDTDTDAARH